MVGLTFEKISGDASNGAPMIKCTRVKIFKSLGSVDSDINRRELIHASVKHSVVADTSKVIRVHWHELIR